MTLEEALKILSKRRYLAAEEARYYTEIAFSLEGYEKIRQQITACNAEIALGNASLEKYRESLILQRDEILRNAGLSYDMLFPRYTCSCCNDTGYADVSKPCSTKVPKSIFPTPTWISRISVRKKKTYPLIGNACPLHSAKANKTCSSQEKPEAEKLICLSPFIKR